MAHHDVVDNNPKKEILMSLVGIGLFLLLIAGIAVSAWLRPAGDHPATATSPATQEAQLVNPDSASTAPAQAENAGEPIVTPQTGTTATTGTAAPATTDNTTPPENPDAAAATDTATNATANPSPTDTAQTSNAQATQTGQ